MVADNHDEEEPIEKTSIFSSDTVRVKAAERVPPCLVLLIGPNELIGRQWPLDRNSLVLGRSLTSDIQITEMSLSKSHVKFVTQDGRVSVADMGATNTTLINEVALVPHKLTVIKNNDRVQTGSLVFKFLEHGLVSETAEKARMQNELERARTVQETLLPQKTEAVYGWGHLAGIYRSASECSGDWWWHWSCGHRAFVLIGDTTGHGAGSAMITSAARSALATIENNPDVALEQVYNTLTHAIHSCGGGKLSMSAFMVEIDLTKKGFRYINASHVPALILPKGAINWNELEHLSDPVASPLGSDEPKMQIGTKVLAGGQRVVLMTDGLTERLDHHGVMVKERLFYGKVLEAHKSCPDSPKKFLESLLTKSDHLAGMAPQNDDITIVSLDVT
jgi:hypothetical protein